MTETTEPATAEPTASGAKRAPLRRDLAHLTERPYDVVVVGGGIFGVCLAWEAASRGLRAVVLERGDFCEGTSANSYKIIHGGIRYLQHGDVRRIRESAAERRSLLTIAPHLAQPLPIAVPTYHGLMKGKTAMRVALGLYDLFTADRNSGVREPRNHIPRGRILSRRETLERFPLLDPAGVTGAALFHDGQMYNPTRLAVSFLRSAVEAGADAANYVEVESFLREGDRVTGVRAMDTMSGETLEVRGRIVVNAAGSWAPRLLKTLEGASLPRRPTFSRDACFVVPRRLTDDTALAFAGATKDPDALLSRGERHLFLVPWRDYTLVGVWHKVYEGDPDRIDVTEEELQRFLDEVNGGLPQLGLRLEDIALWNAGLVLFGENRPGATNLSYGKRSIIIDHADCDGIEGLMTVIGVRYTTARGVAERTLDRGARRAGLDIRPSATAHTPIHGGDLESLDGLVRELSTRTAGTPLPAACSEALVRNHGSRYGDVLSHAEEDESLLQPVGDSTTLRAEIVHAVRDEMALTLADAIFRRTDLATGNHPGNAALDDCARLMARDLHWDEARVGHEKTAVQARFVRR